MFDRCNGLYAFYVYVGKTANKYVLQGGIPKKAKAQVVSTNVQKHMFRLKWQSFLQAIVIIGMTLNRLERVMV